MDDRLTELSCEEFSERLASAGAEPGGGGAAALVGALAAALCSMAGAHTVGRPRYAAVEADVERIMEDAEDVRYRLLDLVREDAAGFAAVVDALALPADDPTRPTARARALEGACMAPLAMMGECCRAIVLLEEIETRCSPSLRSDVACGALIARAALEAASVNVYVNTALLEPGATVASIESAAAEMLDEFVPRAQGVAARLMPASVRP